MESLIFSPSPPALTELVKPYVTKFGWQTLALHIHQVIAAITIDLLISTKSRNPRVVSFINSAIICVLAIWDLWSMDTAGTLKGNFGPSRIEGHIQAYATGFFIWNTVIGVWHLDILLIISQAESACAVNIFNLGFVSITLRRDLKSGNKERLTDAYLLAGTAGTCLRLGWGIWKTVSLFGQLDYFVVGGTIQCYFNNCIPDVLPGGMSGYIQLGLSDIASGIARPFLRKSSARNSLPFVPFAAYLGLNVIVILCDCYILYHPASKSRKGSDQEKDHHPAPEAQNTVPKRTIIEPGEQYVQIIEKFKRTITNLRGQVEQMKAREYERGKRFPHPPHEHISYEFQHIYYLGSDWAKNFFTIQIRDFDISRFPAFGEQLKEVSWDNSDWGGMQHFNASHLVQAVLGNMICQGIFLSPFSGTPPAFRRAYQPMYDKMCAEDSEEAERWRTKSLLTFYSFTEWPPRDQESLPLDQDSRTLQSYKDQHVTDIVHSIWEILSPITTTHFPQLTSAELSLRREQLRVIVDYAKALGEKMSKQSASRLQIFSKSGIEGASEPFKPDDRIESRFDREDYDSEKDLRIVLILWPGFLKWGNDNAENLDQWCVWTRAIVELHGTFKPLLESQEGGQKRCSDLQILNPNKN